jgi:hypothetical protein
MHLAFRDVDVANGGDTAIGPADPARTNCDLFMHFDPLMRSAA